MRIYRFDVGGHPHLGIEQCEGDLVDLTAVRPRANSVGTLLDAASHGDTTVDAIVERALEGTEPPVHRLADIIDAGRLLVPLLPPEVWGAGVTYQRSMEGRREESGTPDIYSRVYEEERPELFFKSTASRIVGPFEDVGIRADSAWNVPEPELAVVLWDGRVAGYMVGNDMASRDIEGDNPLYLTQAKVYARSCAVGPCYVSPGSLDPGALAIRATIERDGSQVYAGESNTGKMARTFDELASWLTRHNAVPDGSVLLTGTGIVPPAAFTLEAGDIIRIAIDGIGTLENKVRVV